MSFASDIETIHIEENKSNILEPSEIRVTIEQKLVDHLFHNEIQLFKQTLESVRDPVINIIPLRDKKQYNSNFFKKNCLSFVRKCCILLL